MTIDPDPNDPNDPNAIGPKPEPITAKSLGYFNLIFGILFILATAFEAGVVLAMPSIGMLTSWASAQEQEQRERTWQAQREDFDQRLEDAEDDVQREVIEAERTLSEMNHQGGTNWLGFSLKFLDEPSLRVGVLAKLGVMVALNGLLIASGVGLIRLRRWGRTTARLSSFLLIPATLGFTIAAVGAVPGMAERWTDEMQAMLFEDPAGPEGQPEVVVEGLDQYERGMGRLFLGSLVLSSGLALIYPVVVFAIASRAGVREATVVKGE